MMAYSEGRREEEINRIELRSERKGRKEREKWMDAR